MGHFYVDESIHPRGGFALGAFVYSRESLDDYVATVTREHGVAEYKSGARVDTHPEMVKVRSKLFDLFGGLAVRVGVAVSPVHTRDEFATDLIACLSKLVERNRLHGDVQEVHFDEGLFVPPGSVASRIKGARLPASVTIHASQDSKIVAGIQVADLAAHTLSGMLLERLGLIAKTVKAGPNSGYEPETEFELGFELWARMRYSLFCCADPTLSGSADAPTLVADVSSCGLHVSSRCDTNIRDAALDRFGTVYWGCIH